jgi:hypothetical protein
MPAKRIALYAVAIVAVVAIVFMAFGRKAATDQQAAAIKIDFVGGGFIFNYRTADHYYGFVARPVGPLPEGARLEAHFEVPGGGEQVVSEDATRGKLQYVFQTSGLHGIEKDHPYRAKLVVRDGQSGQELASFERTFKTEVDQASLPDSPLVIGPGYQQPN